MPDYDLKAFLDDDPLILNGVVSEKYPKGHSYSAPDLPHRDKLRLFQILTEAKGPAAAAIKKEGPLALLSSQMGEQMREFCTVGRTVMRPGERLLGDAWRQMSDDGVSSTRMDRLEMIAVLHYAGGQGLTTAILQAASGEAMAAANRASRRAAAKKSTASSPRAGSSTTRQPASRAKAPTSSATRGRTTGRASTPASKTSARNTVRAPRKTA